MKIFLLQEVPNQVTEEDIETEFSEFGTVEYVEIKPRPFRPSGRMAVIKMTEVCGDSRGSSRKNSRVPRERRLRLVKVGPKKTQEEETRKPLPDSGEKQKREEETKNPILKDKRLNPIVRAFEQFFTFLKGFASRH